MSEDEEYTSEDCRPSYYKGNWTDNPNRWVDLYVGEILRETDKAFLLDLADGGDEVWMPKSQIEDAHAYEVGETDFEMRVTRWIMEQKNLL